MVGSDHLFNQPAGMYSKSLDPGAVNGAASFRLFEDAGGSEKCQLSNEPLR